MGRISKIRRLHLWMNGTKVGVWSHSSKGVHEFCYDSAWVNSPAARPVSLSLPLAPAERVYTGERVANFFDNLLPDNQEIRKRIQQRFGIASSAPFDLLAEIGRDCVGAIQLLPEGMEPGDIRTITAQPLDETELESIMRSVNTLSFQENKELDFFRISVAGAQEKTALFFQNGRWHHPLGTTPTTHILKLPLGSLGPLQIDMSRSVENEWLCSRLASAFGFKAAPSEMVTFGSEKVLAVERFDRRLAEDRSWWMRLPVEDLCQATGRAPVTKYEADGGPGIVESMRFFLNARTAFEDRAAFFKTQLFFWMLAAPDGHAKNFSIFIEPGGRFSMTPLYDIMSAYPVIGHGKGRIPAEKLRMAMAIQGRNRHYEWARILRRHWVSTSALCGFSANIETVISELIENTPRAIAAVAGTLPKDFPDSVATPIFEGLSRAALVLAESA